MNKSDWTDPELAIAQKMRNEGYDFDEIGDELGRTRDAVRIKLGRSNTVGRRAFTENRSGNSAEISATVPRIMGDDDLLKYLGVNGDDWKITRVIYGEREVYRKDRSVKWDVKDGVVTSGKVRDSGKILVEPLISVKVFIEKRIHEIAARSDVNEFIEKAKKHAPKYKKIKYKKIKEPVLYEVEMPDLQLGRVVMESEAGYELNPDVAVKAARKSMEILLGYASFFPVGQIVFPIGHDFFDSNNADNKTVHGTLQRDDPRWQRTYKLGKDLLIESIENMSAIAPVHVPVIVGNHDEERMFYLGDSLASWFNRNPNVTIDNRENKRKYYAFGKCLIGFTHGYFEPLKSLPHLMAVEEKQLWANSTFREWHVGDKHHKDVTVTQPAKEYPGTVVRIIRSIASPSVWEHDKGFKGSIKATESFVWHKEKGMIAQFTAPADVQ